MLGYFVSNPTDEGSIVLQQYPRTVFYVGEPLKISCTFKGPNLHMAEVFGIQTDIENRTSGAENGMSRLTVTFMKKRAEYRHAGLYFCEAFSLNSTVLPLGVEFEVTVKGERCITTKSLT